VILQVQVELSHHLKKVCRWDFMEVSEVSVVVLLSVFHNKTVSATATMALENCCGFNQHPETEGFDEHVDGLVDGKLAAADELVAWGRDGAGKLSSVFVMINPVGGKSCRWDGALSETSLGANQG